MTQENIYQTTRPSLLTRLKDLEDQKSWQEFFETYWRLIYNVALKCGLSHEESQDIVQESILRAVENIGRFERRNRKGAFKAWLRTIARSQIAMFWRSRKSRPEARTDHDIEPDALAAEADLEKIWDEEWRKNIQHAALTQLKLHSRPRHYQIFHAYVIQEMDAKRVAKTFGVGMSQVYVIKHRMGARYEAELAKLREEG